MTRFCAPAGRPLVWRGTGSGMEIRAFREDDFDAVVPRWHETNRVSYRYVALHQRHTLADARRYFRDVLLATSEIWLADLGDAPQGLLALEAPWIRQLAVFPEWQRCGVGSALMQKARERSPAELRLYTFQRNEAARAFYAKCGFIPVAFGISPAPELEPDVECAWIAR